MPTRYCDWSDVSNRLSASGASLRVDDNPVDAQADILDEATAIVNGYCALLYDPVDLAASTWIRFATRNVAVYLACGRRNNPVPEGVAALYESTLARLTMVETGRLTIPDAPQRKMMAPVLSNLRVQQGPVSEIKVVTGTSTGRAAGYTQFEDYWDRIDYSLP